MKVTLIDYPQKGSVNITAASARTCYSTKALKPEAMEKWSGRHDMIKGLFSSGHHTTIQHPTYVFLLEDVSRFVIWRYLHAHTYYNSDQVSQRYAKISFDSAYLPKNYDPIKLKKIEDMYSVLEGNYVRIVELLEEDFKGSDNRVERKIANKKAMENARYILPQNTSANLYHTINLSVLLRYISLSENSLSSFEGGQEFHDLVKAMEASVLEENPDLKDLFDQARTPNKSETLKFYDAEEVIGKKINIDEYIILNKETLKDITVYGDEDLYQDQSNIYSIFQTPDSTETISFAYKLSLSADAQNQRHRGFTSIKPSIKDEIRKSFDRGSFAVDHYCPSPITANEEAKSLFDQSLGLIKNTLSEIGIDDPYAPYLVPNSYLIPIKETGSITNVIHKFKLRTCLNAQEEIRFATDKMISLLKSYGFTSNMLVPPCVLRNRAGVRPICPEGPRFCGIKEWKLDKYKI